MIKKEEFVLLGKEYGMPDAMIEDLWMRGADLHETTDIIDVRRAFDVTYPKGGKHQNCTHPGLCDDAVILKLVGFIQEFCPEALMKDIAGENGMSSALAIKHNVSLTQYEASRVMSAIAISIRVGKFEEFMEMINRWTDMNLLPTRSAFEGPMESV